MDKTIGIFGGGQLGRMMAQAALPLNIQCTFFEASTDCPSATLGQVISSKAENGLQDFIDSADVFSLEFENTPIYNSAYIEGIGNLYEFDCGELSGWMYQVNGWFPNYGCSRYQLKEGDQVQWVYTCDLGADVGGNYSARNGK